MLEHVDAHHVLGEARPQLGFARGDHSGRMSVDQGVVDRIDEEYDRGSGFLGQLRTGMFDRAGADRLLALLDSLDLGDGPIDRRLVQLLWLMPTFIQWQVDRVPEDDRLATQAVFDRVLSILEAKIGVP